jgi:PleD family two-component response regulator
LLVDDRDEDLLALEVTLERPEVRLVKASSGPRALRCVLEEDFALILLDVTMPGMDGFELATLIKQRPQNRHTPIIFLTSEGKDLESIYRGYEAGGVDYILKPLDPDIVRAKVAVFVELHRRGEEIRRQAELLQDAERARRDIELDELRRVTDREQVARAEAESALSRLLSIASRELRAPLSALELTAQSLLVQLGEPEVDMARVRAKVEVAERQLGRLTRLIDEMLDVPRIEGGPRSRAPPADRAQR